jgi:hypothetical protein
MLVAVLDQLDPFRYALAISAIVVMAVAFAGFIAVRIIRVVRERE